MTEIVFLVEEAPGGGFIARALTEAIITGAEDRDNLHRQVRDAVLCHFDEGQAPRMTRLHYTRDEVIAV